MHKSRKTRDDRRGDKTGEGMGSDLSLCHHQQHSIIKIPQASEQRDQRWQGGTLKYTLTHSNSLSTNGRGSNGGRGSNVLAALKGWETCALSLWNHNRFVSSTRKTVSHAPALFYYLFYTLYLQETVFTAENAVAKPTILILYCSTFLH